MTMSTKKDHDMTRSYSERRLRNKQDNDHKGQGSYCDSLVWRRGRDCIVQMIKSLRCNKRDTVSG